MAASVSISRQATPGRGGHRVSVEGASPGDVSGDRVHGLHDLARSPERPNREASPDDLGEGAQIGADAVDGLGASPVEAEGLDLIEDQNGAIRSGGLSEEAQEVGAGRYVSRGAQDGLDDYGG